MHVTIKGLTASVITINSMGLIIRGDSNDEKNISGSVARHLNVDEKQLGELEGLRKAGLIAIEYENTISENIPVVQPINKTIPKVMPPEIKKVETPQEPQKKTEKTGKKEKIKVAGKTLKKIKKVQLVQSNDNSDEDSDEDSEVTVVTADGTIKSKTFNKPVEIGESKATMASIEAMEKLEQEEKELKEAEDRGIDEKSLDPVDRMGEEATIVIGGKITKKVAMKNSILPHADSIKKAEKFIDKNDKDGDDPANRAFIES